MSVETTHEGCHVCQRMAREAERTEREHDIFTETYEEVRSL